MAGTKKPGKTDPRRSSQPRLDIRGPMAIGFSVLALSFGAALSAAAYVPLDNGVLLSGVVVFEAKAQPVRHKTGGKVGAVLVRELDIVKSGDVIATLDTSQLDQQIAAFKAQSDAARRQLTLIRKQAVAFAERLDKSLADRSKVLALEIRVAQIEKEAAGFVARIAAAEQQLAQMRIRAPISGKIHLIAVRAAGSVIHPGQVIAAISPLDGRLVLEGKLSTAAVGTVTPGMMAKVWPDSMSWRDSRPFSARLAHISTDTVGHDRSGAKYVLARVKLDETPAETGRHVQLRSGMRVKVLLHNGERTLIDQLIEPVVRNLHLALQP